MSGTIAAPPRPGFSLPIQEVRAAGLTAWLVEDHSVPVVSLSWSWRGGAALDPAGAEGTAAMAAALLTEGAGPLRATAFADALRDEAIGLSFGAERDSFEGGFRALSEALPEAVRLARLAMAEPRLDPDAVERVRRAPSPPRGAAWRPRAARPAAPSGPLPIPAIRPADRPAARRRASPASAFPPCARRWRSRSIARACWSPPPAPSPRHASPR